jgi:hypothetical protein
MTSRLHAVLPGQSLHKSADAQIGRWPDIAHGWDTIPPGKVRASYRVTGTCMGLGPAAGLAAAMATKAQATPKEIDGRELRAALKHRGVRFL